MSSLKILAVGPVLGQFGALRDHIQQIFAASQGETYDLCICVGPFFDDGSTPNEDLISNERYLKEQARALLLHPYEVHHDLHLESQGISSKSKIKQESLGDAVEPEALHFPIPVLFVDAGKMPAGIAPLIEAQAWASDSSQKFSISNRRHRNADPFASQCCVHLKENLYMFQAKGGMLNFSLPNKHPVSIIYTGHGASSLGAEHLRGTKGGILVSNRWGETDFLSDEQRVSW
jgi:hypothetical protein